MYSYVRIMLTPLAVQRRRRLAVTRVSSADDVCTIYLLLLSAYWAKGL